MTPDLLLQCLALATSLDRLAVLVIQPLEAKQNDSIRIFSMTTAVRSLTYFRGVSTLVRADLIEPAGAALRVLLELLFVLKSVHSNSDQLAALIEQSNSEKHKALTGLLKVGKESRPDDLTDDVLRASLNELGTPRGGYSVHHWATQSGDIETYHTMYRKLNLYSHGGLGALEAYLPTNDSGKVVRVRSEVDTEFGPQFLLSSSSILLDVLRILTDKKEARRYQERFDSIGGELERLQRLIASDATVFG